LRHTFASVGAGEGLSLPIIGRRLGHTQTRTTQRYAHLADDPVREAVDKITNSNQQCGKAGRRRDDATAASVMSGAKEIVESIAELFVATAGSASASSIACWRGVRRPNGRRGDQYLIQLSRRPPEISLQSFSDCGRSRCDHRAVFPVIAMYSSNLPLWRCAARTVEFALQWEHCCGPGVNRAAKKPAPRGRRRRPVFLHAYLRHPHPFGTTAVVVVRV